MPERLTEAEVAAVRERALAIKADSDRGEWMGPEWTEAKDVLRLLATLEASEARVRALVAAIEACDQAMSSLGDGTEWDWVVLYQVKAGHWHKVLGIARGAMPIDGALTRGEAGTDGE